jgi:HsdM N-terminal domain
MNYDTDKSLESWMWDAACSIRGAQEAPKFKDFILPLVFTKRLYDVFDDELIQGVMPQFVPQCVASPTGFEPVFWP